jgi:hypothetical protein
MCWVCKRACWEDSCISILDRISNKNIIGPDTVQEGEQLYEST